MPGTVEILQAGPMMTVQDPGRRGYLKYGVSASGPMDRDSFAVANALVGNDADCAVLEFALTGGTLRLSQDRTVAVTGGMVDIAAEGTRLAPWAAYRVRAGSEIHIGALRGAVWGYVAISGGIETAPVMGSRATHLRSAIGGHEGRRLEPGDMLPVGEDTGAPLRRLVSPLRPQGGRIAVIPGPQDDYFDEAAWSLFLSKPFTVASMRDRMAMMLDGAPVHAHRGHDIVSDGTLMGSIQVPSSGRLIVLMADRQSTGGYPKIATVASADLPRLAQAPSGSPVRFHRITAARGEDLEREARGRLDQVLAELAET